MLLESHLVVDARVHIAELDGIVDTGRIDSIGRSSVTVEWMNSPMRLKVFERADAMRRLSPGRLPWNGRESIADVCSRVARENEYERTRARLAQLENERAADR